MAACTVGVRESVRESQRLSDVGENEHGGGRRREGGEGTKKGTRAILRVRSALCAKLRGKRERENSGCGVLPG